MVLERSVSGHLDFAVYHVEEASYPLLDLVDLVDPYWVLSFVRKAGEVATSTGDYRAVARPGDVMIHPPYLPFCEKSSTPGTHHWLRMKFHADPARGLFSLPARPQVISITHPKRYEAAFGELMQAWQADVAASRSLEVVSRTLQLVAMIFEAMPPQPDEDDAPSGRRGYEDDRLRRVITLLTRHLGEKLNRKVIAAHVHLNPIYLDRIFFARYGVTPMQMLRNLRLRRVQELLEQSELPLSEIAADCGLGDAAYVHRVFTQRFGVSPGQYREDLRRSKQSYLPTMGESE